MDGLRWLLLGFGLFVVAGVYLYTRYQRGRAESQDEAGFSGDRVEPSLGELDSVDGNSLESPDVDDNAVMQSGDDATGFTPENSDAPRDCSQ